jgi:hypothetical protein
MRARNVVDGKSMSISRHTFSRRQFLESAGLASLTLAFRPTPANPQHEGDHLVT